LWRAGRAPRGGTRRDERPGSPMNNARGIAFKLISTVLFAVMATLVRYLGSRYPVGQLVFFRSAFAIIPVVVVYAFRGELAAMLRTGRPLGQLGRGTISIGGMFFNFGALARLPLVEANAISFTAPLFTVVLSVFILKERVRIYRWSAVLIGFLGVLVMLLPHFGVSTAVAGAAGTVGVAMAFAAAVCNAGNVIQTRRLTQSETTQSIVFYFSIICALAGLATLPFGWLAPTWGELAALVTMGLLGGTAHIFLTESYRNATASVVAPFDYTAMIWALLLGYLVFGELPAAIVYLGAAIVMAAGLFVIWRERQLGLERVRTSAIEGPPVGGPDDLKKP
jgi:drug/metabolite transporter (DMT)-like permease